MIGSNGQSVELGRQIGAGGEGQVFELVGDSRVAKIYHADQLTSNRIAKLDLMASRAVSRKEVCWPEQLVYSLDKCAVGYVMQRAHGYPLQKSVFVKPLLLERFPNWQRENLVNICIAFLEHLQYLHSLNVLVGDINPMNVLVHGDGSEVFIVDADSFQVEGFPCPVGTVNFSPSQLQNVNFKSILRSEDDELFAIATMLFMILVPGKGDMEVALMVNAYSSRLGQYPADVARHALLKHSWKWWPTWDELKRVCDAKAGPRRQMIAALHQPEPDPEPVRRPPTQEERDRMQKIVDEMFPQRSAYERKAAVAEVLKGNCMKDSAA